MSKLLDRIRKLEAARQPTSIEPAIQWHTIPGESQSEELDRFRHAHPGVPDGLLTEVWDCDEPVPALMYL